MIIKHLTETNGPYFFLTPYFYVSLFKIFKLSSSITAIEGCVWTGGNHSPLQALKRSTTNHVDFVSVRILKASNWYLSLSLIY